jgi:hypothetical protein
MGKGLVMTAPRRFTWSPGIERLAKPAPADNPDDEQFIGKPYDSAALATIIGACLQTLSRPAGRVHNGSWLSRCRQKSSTPSLSTSMWVNPELSVSRSSASVRASSSS